MSTLAITVLVLVLLVAGLALQDLLQKKHTIRRNFPIVGRLRYYLELLGDPLRQYIVTGNDAERPFSRDQRRWVYATSKHENELFGFGTDNDLELNPNYLIIKHAAFPWRQVNPRGDPLHLMPTLKKLGGWRNRPLAFYPDSAVWISAMSFGALSGPAVEALNRGAALARCLQNTGEGGISPYHQMGGDLIWQIGTGYFGCRDADGNFNLDAFRKTIRDNAARVRAIEVKISQGAKAKGGVLPAVKVTEEIARIRGIKPWVECVSPPYHKAFSTVAELIDFVEVLAKESGLPVGIKSAIGELEFWDELAAEMAKQQRGPDFITIDGGEGGTGAAPLVFADHVALPWKVAFTRLFAVFAKYELHKQVFFVGSGKLGFPATACLAFSLGCDAIAVAREAMLSIGCIQAQKCHTGNCPTGVATQKWWLTRGLDPTLKANRAANYIAGLRHEILSVCAACGVPHPSLLNPKQFEILDDHFGSQTADEVFGYDVAWRPAPSKERLVQIGRIFEKDGYERREELLGATHLN